MKTLILFLALVIGLGASDRKAPTPPELVECRGTVEKFEKRGVSYLEEVCRWYDVTWIIIKEPEEFAGIRHREETPSQAKGLEPKVGDPITFKASRAMLKSEKQEAEKNSFRFEVRQK